MSRRLREQFTAMVSDGGKPRIEETEDSFLIHDVVVLRENGNCRYPEETRRDALGLLEGCRVMIDHLPSTPPGAGRRGFRPPDRSYRDVVGSLRNLRETGRGTYGTLQINKHHPEARKIVADARSNSTSFGLSLEGEGDKEKVGDEVVVRKITSVDGVAIVAFPAHRGGLFEGRRMKTATTEKQMKVKDLIEALKPKRPGMAKALREMADSGITSDETLMEEPEDMETPADMTADGDHSATFIQGVKDAIGHVLDDESMSWEEKTKQVMQYLKTAKKHTDGNGGADDAFDPAAVEEAEEEEIEEAEEEELEEECDDKDKKPMKESRKKAKPKPGASLRESALEQLAAKKVTLTPLVLRAVDGCRTREHVTALVESLDAEAPARPGARSAAPTSAAERKLTEQREKQQKADDTPEARAARVRAARLARG